MKKPMLCAGLMLMMSVAVADVPVYKDGQLQLDKVAVYKKDGLQYYSQVTLTAQEDGDFSIEKASKNTLPGIESVAVSVTPATTQVAAQILLSVEGIRAIPCETLLDPIVIVEKNVVHVVLAESLQEKGEVCMTLLAITPFTTEISLTEYNLASGQYDLKLNGFDSQFTVP